MNNQSITETLENLNIAPQELGVIVVDHGSRVDRSNQLLNNVVELFVASSGLVIVEPAHMELSEPSIATAFDRCVSRGATTVVVHPYFLLPGRHWQDDIPRLAAAAAAKHAGVHHIVTAPLGIHPLMAAIMEDRIRQCLLAVNGAGEPCSLCEDEPKCASSAGPNVDR